MARLHRKAGAALCAALGLAIVPLISVDAQADATYAAVADATGARVIFTNESIPLNVAPQLQGPSASAVQNSLQQSDAYAAFPYPGEEVAGIPGVVGGASGVPLPAYPFVIATSYGDGAKQLSYPGIELRSESTETLTQATATGGSTGAGGTSSARVARDSDGGVAAKAATDLDALRIGESLVISGLHGVASASRDSAGELTRLSSLSFTRLSAQGVVIGLTDGKFSLQSGAEAPTQNDVPAAQIAQALTDAGYPTTYQAPQETPDGIIGAGLQIQTTFPAPPAIPGGISGETPVTYTIGLLRAEVAYTVLPNAPAATAPGVDAATAVPGRPRAAHHRPRRAARHRACPGTRRAGRRHRPGLAAGHPGRGRLGRGLDLPDGRRRRPGRGRRLCRSVQGSSLMSLIAWARVQWDRALGALAVLIGAILLLVGWVKISDTGFVSEQLPYLASAGLGGVFLLGLGGMLWLSADLRDQWRELRGIRARLDATASPASE